MKVVTDSKYYDEIGNYIQHRLGEGTYKPSEMLEKIAIISTNSHRDGIAEGEMIGRQAQYNEFWAVYQNNGARNNYTYAFANDNWTDETFKPKYDMVASSMYYCFCDNDKITAIDKKADGSQLVIDGSNITTTTGFYRAFYGMTQLKRIGLIISRADAPWTQAFNGDTNLVEIRFSGTIGTAFDIHWSTKLSRESLLSILNVCNKQNAGITITLPKNCINGSTTTETYIANDTELSTALTNATDNGYTISFA